MKSNRITLVIIVIAVAAGCIVIPLAVRGGIRYYALHRFLASQPEARERIGIQPKRRILEAMPAVHPVNLGYATFDTGSSSPVSSEVRGSSGVSILLTSGDVRMGFLPPFNPKKSTAPKSATADITEYEASTYPHTANYVRMIESNPIDAEMFVEETRMIPVSKLIFMSKDDFLLYSIVFSNKGGLSWGLNEVQFFESPDARGIVRIGKSAKDRRFASVTLVSRDGTKEIGFSLILSETSSNDISGSLDPVLRTFRFTTDLVDDRDKIKDLIRGAGIQQRVDSALGAESSPTRSTDDGIDRSAP